MYIPSEIAPLRQFVVWKYETRPGEDKPTKVPYNPHSGRGASSTDPSTWGTLDEAQNAFAAGGYSGIGFVIAPPFVGIDFDYCINEQGDIDPPIKEAIDWFDSYTEISPSGKGVHILIKGNFDGKGFNRTVDGRKVEVYQSARYFTLTGVSLNEAPKPIEERFDHIKLFYDHLKQKTEKPREDRPPTTHTPLLLEDEQILTKLRNASNKDKFERLWSGDSSGYTDKDGNNDESRADEALCFMIAFYTRDFSQIDRLFRSSGLYREKWERDSYRTPTINNALNRVTQTYNPNHNSGRIIWGGAEFSKETLLQAEQQRRESKNSATAEIIREEDRPVNRTDVGNAIRLVKKFGAEIRYCFAWEKWLVWDGMRWKVDDAAAVEQMAKETARGILHEAADALDKEDRNALIKWAMASEAAGRIKNMIALAQSEPGVGVRVDDLNSNPYVLNLQNGTLDLMTGEIRAHSKEDLITKLAPVAYDPAAKSYIFDEFLQTVFSGNAELIQFIRRAVGYSLTGDVREQSLFMCYGIGANGKSTMLDLLSDMFGDYAVSLPTQSLMVKYNDGGIPNDIARLNGARFVSAVETDEGKRLSESLVKQLTGTEKISARFMRSEFFDFKPTFKIWMGMNHRPVVTGTDYAIWRRLKLIPFDVVIPEKERDGDLPAKLRDELSGILNWAIAGCLEWGSCGLTVPEVVKVATEGYRHDMDRLADFLQERCNVGEAFRVRSGELYQAYKQWCEQEGARAQDNRKFKNSLIEKGYQLQKKTDGNYYMGLTLLHSSDF